MRALFRRLSSVSLLWQILPPTLLCVAIGIAAIQFWTIRQTRSLLDERLAASLSANLAMLQSDIERLGSGFRHEGDRLLIGDVALNGRDDIVDRVAAVAGGVATIFSSDLRVATTIRKDDGTRAVGTALAPGPARTAVIERSETYRGRAAILGKDYVTIYQPVKDARGTVSGILFVGLPTAPTEAALAASEWQALWASLIVLAVLGIGVWLLLRRVLLPLTAMTSAMRRLATGDLAVAIPAIKREDEVGRMAGALDVFKQQAIDNARLAREQDEQRQRAAQDKRAALVAMAEKVEAETTTSVAAVSRETEQMEKTADELAASAERVGSDTKTASEAADQALANTETVASAAEELSSSIREIGSQVGRANEVVTRAVRTSQTAQETIAALSGRVAQISTVAAMISDIAAKTNLLALNATIEAARAGEAGKGFAVVASEVKTLATQTAHSTEEIGRHISEVTSATDGAVHAVGEVEATINEMNQIATAIAAAVEQQGAATAEIARSVTKTSDAAREVATRVGNVSAQTQQSAQHVGQVHHRLEQLGKAVVDLQHVVVRIVRTSTEEVDRRHEQRVPVNLRAQMTLQGATSAQSVQLENLSPHGAQVMGGPVLLTGTRGSLSIEGTGTPVRFVAQSSESCEGGNTLHLVFQDDAAVIETISGLLRRSGIVAAKAA